MLKNMSSKEKLTTLLNPWMSSIVESVKKDLRNEHLKQDRVFLKKYFNARPPQKLTLEELSAGYQKALETEEKAEDLAEYLLNRWLVNHSDIYYFFEEELKQINPDFSAIETIDLQRAGKIAEKATGEFGSVNTYLFSVMNSVAFPKETLDLLNRAAKVSQEQAERKKEVQVKELSLEKLSQSYEEKIARLQDKYEKKLLGLQKKYTNDVAMLKKQLAAFQRKASS